MRVLAVGAHPDDIEYGVAGTLALHVRRGDHVELLILTAGEKSGNPSTRRREALASARTIGAKEVHWGGLPDTAVPGGIETIRIVEEQVKRGVDRIYIPSVKDAHQDHRSTALAAIAAARYCPQTLSYELPLAHLDFRPAYYVDITKSLSTKTRAIRKFRSQGRKDYLKQSAILALAQFRGYTVNVKFAEAFEVVRYVELERSYRLATKRIQSV